MLDLSRKAKSFTESVIREMTRLCRQHGAVNLAQGFPDFAAPEEIKEAACRAIRADVNQYAITWGAPSLRTAIAEKVRRTYGMSVDPEREIAVTCGATEAMIASILAIVDPGEEVVVFEPFYENYGPDAILAGATPRFVPLRPPDWSFEPDELAAAFNDRTRGIILNTPNNPTGKVFTRDELETIATLCRKWDVVAFSDEIYEHILYDGAVHVPIATLPGMADRTVTINALSKTYSVTGWRVGWTIASPELTSGIRKVHDFLTVGAAAPLQEAGAAALGLPATYYDALARDYAARRDLLLQGLRGVGFQCEPPRGAYYILADATAVGCRDDVSYARRLVETAGVGAVPGSSFFSRPELGRTLLRFAFPKRKETLDEAVARLERALH
ncbi:MAG TPA: aminotransferase class I/II-fold pyridoxal phosphate-dependent enzyme [Candidatus Polarisedimenticolaceae bacterium]|nr:aminotransferase class I/II-fold pyridoxal phosphate-dependent enzyme [Candidatus Polarisedimenticolaceae bacterium]